MILGIDFRAIYSSLSDQKAGNQKRIPVSSCLEVFFGYNREGNLRLSFMSKNAPPIIKSTTILCVVQGRENKDTYWTSFDLLNENLKEAYFSFCENMIESVIGVMDEHSGLNMLRRRFVTWKTLFHKASERDIPKEKIMGLFGELTVLKDIVAPKYGINEAIKAWGGPDSHSKDFTLKHTWYEIKTIGANSNSIHISSLTQLSSELVGHLGIVRVETVSSEYNAKNSTVFDLINGILLMVTDDNAEELFIRKIQNMEMDVFNIDMKYRFIVKSVKLYKVDGGFPRITEETVPYPEISDVNYIINVPSISRFVEQE